MKYEPPPFGPKDLYEDTYDPATMSATSLSTARTVWFRRPWFLITAGVAFVVGVSVLADLPTASTPSSEAASLNASITQINSDLAPCSYAVNEAFNLYTLYVDHRLTPAHYSQSLSLLKDDQAACAFTSNGVADLTTNVEIYPNVAANWVNAALATTPKGISGPLVSWITADSDGAIVDIRLILTSHSVAAARKDLAKQERFLAQDRTTVLADVAHANQLLGGRVHAIKVPILPALPGIA